ncbi:ATP-dependent zinc metalloprotease FtsH [Anaerosoma tenue]|uniref:ATP-dependent zinc metalloprotease FtsH n=1 Tax=Anaerosoma tenue TaxID=2933588 RepID=UPI002260C012|nr:ATP-dependent zinc metalloprotease FtsH [Anaerosoma tenue]MCK8114743.1 ATP-dependent zinc metalloprotease FtsH [Anaerosoma tenue]
MNRNLRTALLYLFFIVLGLLFLANTLQPAGVTDELSYSEFTTALKAGRVVSAEVFARSQEIEGEYYPDDDALAQGEHKVFVTNYLDGAALTEDLKRYEPNEGYTVNMQDNQIWLSLLTSFVPIVIIVIVMFWLINQMQGGNSKVMSFGKSRAKRITRDQPRITFKDVAGVDEAVEELEEIKEFLANPGKFQALGAKIPKGVLLVGPPGTGKTLLARAVAGEAGVPFFTISGSDFVEMFVGVGASRVRDLFEQAKAASPCIVFIDELDAVGRMRGAGLGGGHDEREQTLNQLLVEMDGFDIKDNVIIMAATNRPDVLDAALLRPGRFDRQIMVDRPDLKGRHEILKIHSRGKPLGDDIDLEVLARRTPGFTGADLANLVNEAALLAARHGKKAIDMVELEDAIERVIAGPERKSRIISDKEKRVIAYHESGHALVGHVLPNTDPIHKISIISRGRALGYTLALPVEDKFLSARGEMLDEIAMMLGGRVAEAIAIGDITTGASNDIERATKLARQMVTQYGMSEKLGPMTLGEGQHEVFLGRDFSATPNYSQEIAFEIDKEVRRLIDEAYETAYRILTERREQLDLMADVLVERETVDKDELEALLEGTWAAFLEQEKAKAAERPKEQKPKRGAKKQVEEQVEEQEPEAEAPSDDRPIVDVPPPLGDPGGA